MGKSSIHVRPVSSGSEQHNQRERKLNYVREDLTHMNSSFKIQSIAEAKKEIKENYEKHTNQKMQAKATPIREGVLLIGKQHTSDDLKRVAEKLEERFGIRTIQAYAHKDEGHYDKITNEWKPNYHAHMVFNWTEKDTGKTIKMNKDDMSEMQTIVSNELGLERGQKSTKKHIEATQYKAIKEQEDLEKVFNLKNGLVEAQTTLQQVDSIKKEIEPLRMTKNNLSFEVSTLTVQKEKIRVTTEQEKLQAIRERQNADQEREKIKQLEQEREKTLNAIKKEIEPLQMAKNSLILDVTSLTAAKDKMQMLAKEEEQRAIQERQKADEESQKIKQLEQERDKIGFDTALQRENLAYIKRKGETQQQEIRANEEIIKQQEAKIQRSKGLSRF
jgi:hypothetical protein